MSITHLTNLKDILSEPEDKLSVIDFHATWCAPCKVIAPTFEALAKQYPNVNFLKCDVDAVPDVAQEFAISAMPTFVFLNGSTKVNEVRGANKAVLEEAVRKHSSSSSSSGKFPGKGQTLGGSTAQ